MRKTKVVLLNIVSVVTIASLITGCCGGLEGSAPALDYDESASQAATPTPVSDQDDVPAAYVAGEYSIQHVEQTQRSTQVTYPHQTFSDLTAEVDVRFADDIDFTLGGLLFRWQDDDNHYGFLVWNNGQYGLFKRVNGEFEELVNESSPYLNSGVSGNRLKAVVVGDSISLYVNDQYLIGLTDGSLQEGRVGLHATVHSESPVSTQVFFDNLRVSEPDDTSAVLFEDDFSDPGSGWPEEEYAYGSVSYVAAPGPEEAEMYPTATPEPWEPTEFVSEREVTPEEFFQAVEGDETLEDVYSLAVDEGYTTPEGGGEFIAEDGSTVHALVLSSADETVVVAFHFQLQDRTESLLARVEDDRETIVLYNREGRAEISAQGMRVFDATGNPIEATTSSDRVRPSGLASPVQDCEGPAPNSWSWEDFDHCGRSYSGAAWGQIGACVSTYVALVIGVGVATTAAAPLVLAGGLLAVFWACRVPTICVFRAKVDDWPTYDIRLPTKLQQPCRVDCVAHGDRTAKVTINKYRIQVLVDDDRKPRPDTPRSVEVCAGETGTLKIADCAGHTLNLSPQPPDPTEDDIISYCDPGQLCVLEANDARCVQCRQGHDEDCPEGQECIDDKCQSSAPAIVHFNANPDTIQPLQCATLSWTVQGDVTKVELDGVGVTNRGSTQVCPDKTTRYNLRAEGPGGEDTESSTVYVTSATPTAPTIVDFRVVPESIQPAQCATLSWAVTGNITNVSLNGESVSDSGVRQVCPIRTTPYNLRAEGPGGVNTASVTVNVTTAEGEQGFNRMGRGEFSILTWPDQGLTVYRNEIRLGFPSTGGAVYGTAHLQYRSFENLRNPERPADRVNEYHTYRGTFTPPATLSGTYEGSFSNIDVKSNEDASAWLEVLQEESWVDEWEGTLQDDGTLRLELWWGTERYVHELTLSGGLWTQQQLTVD